MTNKSKFTFYIFSFLITLFVIQIIYLKDNYSISSQSIKMKNNFVKLTTLPDLAVSTEAIFTRNRSLSGIFSVYKDDPSLREYFPSTFTYSHGVHQ